MKKWDPKWNTTDWKGYDNYWAGAKKACDDLGMSLPELSTLNSIYTAGKKDSSLGLSTFYWFWSSSENTAGLVYGVSFSSGNTLDLYKNRSGGKVLCVGD